MFYMPVANEKINRIVWLFSFFVLKRIRYSYFVILILYFYGVKTVIIIKSFDFYMFVLNI